MTNHIFISYSKQDRDFALKLAEDLQEAGFKIWIDRSIGGGDKWRETIEKNLKAAEEVIIVVSPNSMASDWVKHEGSVAYAWDKKLLPILIKPVESLPPGLEGYQWIDFVDQSNEKAEKAFDALVEDLTPPNPVQELLEQALETYRQTGELMSKGLLNVIKENWDSLEISKEANDLFQRSRRKQRRQRNILIAGVITLLFIFAGLAIWGQRNAISERRQKNIRANEALVDDVGLALDNHNPDLALALALEATELQDPPMSAQTALLESVYLTSTKIKFELMEDDWAKSIDVSPDGSYIVTGSVKGNITLWDIQSGEKFVVSDEENKAIESIAFGPGGEKILSGYEDGTVILWSLKGEIIQRLEKAHQGSVYAVAFLSDSTQFVSASEDETIKIWDSTTGESEKLEDHTGPEVGVDINSESHTGPILDVDINSEGTKLVSCSEDKSIIVWNLEDMEPENKLNGHNDYVISCSFSHNDKYLISGSADASAILWDSEQGEMVNKMQKHTDWIYGVEFFPGDEFILSGSADNSLMLWDGSTGKFIQRFDGHQDQITSVAIDPEGRFVVSSSRDNSLRVWDIERVSISSISEKVDAEITSMAFQPNTDNLLAGLSDGTLVFWNTKNNGKKLVSNSEHQTTISSIAFTPNGQYALSGSYDGALILWEVKTQGLEKIKSVKENKTILSIDIKSDGKTAVSGSSDGVVTVWDISADDMQQKHLHVHENVVTTVSFKPEDTKVLYGSQDGRLMIWDYESKKKQSFNELTSGIMSAKFSSDGQLIVSGDTGGTVTIWDAATGEIKHRFSTNQEFILDVSFDKDSRFVLASSTSGVSILWSVPTGRLLRRFYSSPADCSSRTNCLWIWQALIHNQNVFVGSADGHWRKWPLLPTNLGELKKWVSENRYVYELSSKEKGIYQIEP